MLCNGAWFDLYLKSKLVHWLTNNFDHKSLGYLGNNQSRLVIDTWKEIALQA